MGVSRFMTLLAGIAITGCGGVVQVGLANAPALGGSSETRVHHVVANGHDACERTMFPQGEVLRGQLPSCAPPVRAIRPIAAAVASNASDPVAPALVWFDACEADLSPPTPAREEGFTALYLSAPAPWTACDARGTDGRSGEHFERIPAHKALGGLAIALP
jgi:hypothetical protein